jgi:hypothetical protein
MNPTTRHIGPRARTRHREIHSTPSDLPDTEPSDRSGAGDDLLDTIARMRTLNRDHRTLRGDVDGIDSCDLG